MTDVDLPERASNGCRDPDRTGNSRSFGSLSKVGRWVATVLMLVANAQAAWAECKLPDGRRIMGGAPVRQQDFPWQVALYEGSSFICGGSLIGAQWVLTAAHCVDASDDVPYIPTVPVLIRPSKLRVMHGATDLGAKGGTWRSVAAIHAHPRYNGEVPREGADGDIALLRLAAPISSAKKAYGGLLVSASEAAKFVVPGACALVSGWGHRRPDGSVSKQLHAAGILISDQRTCRAQLSEPGNVISSGELCAGWLSGGRDTCQGDSGGPLVVEGLGKGHYILAGVTSWGSGDCGQKGKPGVYARVSHYMPWILRMVGGR